MNIKVLREPAASEKPASLEIGASTPATLSAADEAVVRRRRSRRRRQKATLFGLRLLLLVVILTVWQIGSGRFLDPFYYSSPTEIVGTIRRWIESGELWHNLSVTIKEASLGFAIGASAAVVLGILAGEWKLFADVIKPYLVALYSAPKVAMIPLFIIWFGIGTQPKVVLAGITVFFLVFYSTVSGMQQVDRELVDVVRVLGARRHHILLKVSIPSALTSIFTGLHISVPYAVVGAVTGELFASNEGMGHLISRSAAFFQTDGVLAGIVVLIIFTSILNGVLEAVERRVLRWRTSSESTVTSLPI